MNASWFSLVDIMCDFPVGILSLLRSPPSLLDRKPTKSCDLVSFFFVSQAPTSPWARTHSVLSEYLLEEWNHVWKSLPWLLEKPRLHLFGSLPTSCYWSCRKSIPLRAALPEKCLLVLWEVHLSSGWSDDLAFHHFLPSTYIEVQRHRCCRFCWFVPTYSPFRFVGIMVL